MSKKAKRLRATIPQWRVYTTTPPKVAIAVLAASVLAIAIPKGLNAALPEASVANPAVDLVLASNPDDAWKTTVTQQNGETVPCHEISAGMMTGWGCLGSEVKTHAFETPDPAELEDSAQPIRRVIRATNFSDLPTGGTVTTHGPMTILRLNETESNEVDKNLKPGQTVTGFYIASPPGPDSLSYVVLVEGDQTMADNVQRSLEETLDKKGAQK